MDLVNNQEMWSEIVLLQQPVYKPVPLLITPGQAVVRPAEMERARALGRLTTAG